MWKKADKKFTWMIKDLSFSECPFMCSDKFVIGGCKWNLMAFPNRDKDENAKWVDQKSPFFGFIAIIPISKLHTKDGGFLVNGEVKIVEEVEVLEVIGELDEPKKTTLPKREDAAGSKDLLKETSSVKDEGIDVNGFQVLPSQVELVKRIFKKHPYIALEVRSKNQQLRKACMNVLLNLIETLSQSLQELSNEDLMEADNALTYLKDSGFKVDWLEKKLETVKEIKEEGRADRCGSDARIRGSTPEL
ncbi:unnamed protein product [Arabis nemorensis]|uniref:MATH domain-containing protein n=1 Tax=Arabis nemorensis TaxID=586526 RepID=A0A565BXL9_9BRAS|nr:unnamed protein product [Arabis nemorensis]